MENSNSDYNNYLLFFLDELNKIDSYKSKIIYDDIKNKINNDVNSDNIRMLCDMTIFLESEKNTKIPFYHEWYITMGKNIEYLNYYNYVNDILINIDSKFSKLCIDEIINNMDINNITIDDVKKIQNISIFLENTENKKFKSYTSWYKYDYL